MPAYKSCSGSPFRVVSAADKTGFNTGNLTAAFDVGVLGTMPPIYEWFRGTTAGPTPSQLPVPAQASIYLNNQAVSFTYPVGGSVFSPSQPVPMRDGDSLYFYWNLASSTAVPPVVTLWFRYDTDIPENRNYAG